MGAVSNTPSSTVLPPYQRCVLGRLMSFFFLYTLSIFRPCVTTGQSPVLQANQCRTRPYRIAASPPCHRRRILILDAAPPLNHLRISVTFVSAQSFFGHGFFNAGAPATRGSTMLYSGTACDPRIGQGAAVHGHGTHGFTSHQEPRSLISGGG